ncbi:hypothetical protein [Pseudoalteromonas shioyasakiensis]|uniref:hypothetical protein n=1 Tax=Pseudoalteromonas shioyasakiensis TaxID=1190813 RepID=UPI000783A68F|nr:hypothetical protein [Pseudoalteromonas shioyasakiensis]
MLKLASMNLVAYFLIGISLNIHAALITKSKEVGARVKAEPYLGVGELDSLQLAADFSLRRKIAWQISAEVLAPAKQQAGFGFVMENSPASLWQTWFSRDDITYLLDAIDSNVALTDSGLTEIAAKKLLTKIQRLKSPNFDPAPLTGGFQPFSPAVYNSDYVLHILQNFRSIAKCSPVSIKLMDAPLTNKASHSNCMAEFPPTSIMMKLAWGEAKSQNDIGFCHKSDVKDLSPIGVHEVIANSSEWIKKGEYCLDKKNSFMIRDGERVFVLKGFHIVTKELKDWIWISFIWQPEADKGFGSDRPDNINDIYTNYIMLVSVNELEMDSSPGDGMNNFPLFSGSKKLFLSYRNKSKLITWNSNPFIEGPDSTSNCISCHQGIFATGKFGPHTERKHFPYDYTFGTQNRESILMPRVSFREAIDRAEARLGSSYKSDKYQ